jgi:hypothetical protein
MKTINELWEDFDAGEDENEYVNLERNNPIRAQRIERLIRAGASPAEIATRFFRLHPNRWPESRAILAAGRYLKSQED